MKTYLFAVLILAFVSCTKNSKPEADMTLNSSDATAVTGMTLEVSNMRQTSSQLSSATTLQQRRYWDSAFHRHDSIYWNHHNNYNMGNNHPHNDHHHQWVPYDPTINHAHHHHHVHPGHPNDSLVVVSNGHHPHHNIHHPLIHSLHDHHIADSLDHVHHLHHP